MLTPSDLSFTESGFQYKTQGRGFQCTSISMDYMLAHTDLEFTMSKSGFLSGIVIHIRVHMTEGSGASGDGLSSSDNDGKTAANDRAERPERKNGDALAEHFSVIDSSDKGSHWVSVKPACMCVCLCVRVLVCACACMYVCVHKHTRGSSFSIIHCYG